MSKKKVNKTASEEQSEKEKKVSKKKKFITVFVLSLFLLSILAIGAAKFFYKDISIEEAMNDLDQLPNVDLINCLNEKGVKVYISKYCSHCQDQKESIGNSFWSLNWTDCSDDLELCRANNISSVPAWTVSGDVYLGSKSVFELKKLFNC